MSERGREQLANYFQRKISRRDHLGILFKGLGVTLGVSALTLARFKVANAEVDVDAPLYMLHSATPALVASILTQNFQAGRVPFKPTEIVDVMLGKKDMPDKPMFSMIFDDGLEDQLAVLAVLREWGAPSGFAIIGPDWVKAGGDHVHKYMNSNQVKDLSREHEVVSHSNTHRNLVAVWNHSQDELINELEFSQKNLQNLTEQQVEGFCYPGGASNQAIQAEVSKLYKYGLAEDYQKGLIGNHHSPAGRFYMNRVRS